MRTRQNIRFASLERHLHTAAYAALVLAGGYEEAGDNGRFTVRAGNVMFHDEFEAHLDRFSEKGAVVLNLGLPGDCVPGIASVSDPDLVVRIAEKSPEEAAHLLLSLSLRGKPLAGDWPDELAARLSQDPCLKLSDWAEEKGLAAWTVSRGFRQVFGISPEAHRARVRARLALQWIKRTGMPLVAIAAEVGFSDQAHMSRSVRQLTGFGPRTWRRSANRFKTEARVRDSMP